MKSLPEDETLISLIYTKVLPIDPSLQNSVIIRVIRVFILLFLAEFRKAGSARKGPERIEV